MTARKCYSCKETKPANYFNYLPYFRRTSYYCVICENRYKAAQRKVRRKIAAQNKEARDKEKLKSLQEHGLIPSALKKLDKKSKQEALEVAENKLESLFTPARMAIINFSSKIQSSVIVLFLLTFVIPWGFPFPSIILFSALLLLSTIIDPYNKKRDEIVKKHHLKIFNYKKTVLAKQKKFYSSSKWVQLRNQFIKLKRKTCDEIVCEYCSSNLEKSEITVDHVKPRSKYPELALEITNLAIACRSCNSSKGANELTV